MDSKTIPAWKARHDDFEQLIGASPLVQTTFTERPHKSLTITLPISTQGSSMQATDILSGGVEGTVDIQYYHVVFIYRLVDTHTHAHTHGRTHTHNTHTHTQTHIYI